MTIVANVTYYGGVTIRVNRTYSLDYQTIKELNSTISAKHRSRFVDKAIKMQLWGQERVDLAVVDTRRIMAILAARDDCTPEIKALLMMELTK